MPLKQFDSFSSWDEFENAVEKHLDLTFQPLVKSSSKRVAAQNKCVKVPYPLEMVYFYKAFKCSHRGTFKSKSSGSRETKSCKAGCNARITACLDRKNHFNIVITMIDERHNHKIGPELYNQYAKRKSLTTEEKSFARKLCSLKVPNKELQQEMAFFTGKDVTCQDIANVKRAFTKKDLETVMDNSELTDAQILKMKIDKLCENDNSLVSEIGVSRSSEFQYFFLQTSQMKETFCNFPQHVSIGVVPNLNDKSMPLVIFFVVDGLNRYHAVALSVLAVENKFMYDTMFSLFKEFNSSSPDIKTFMIDRNFAGIDSLIEHFPNAAPELCRNQVLKEFRQLAHQCPKEVQADVMDCLEKISDAESEQSYVTLEEKLFSFSCTSLFKSDFLNNWDHVRERWTKYSRIDRVNFGETTNKNVDSYIQRLRKVIPKPLPMGLFFNQLISFYAGEQKQLARSNVSAIMRKGRSQFPYLQQDISQFALRLVEEEYKSVSENLIVKGGKSKKGKISVRNGEHQFTVENLTDCSCSFFKTMMKLPCRHILAARKFKKMNPLISKDNFDKRWFLDVNCPLTAVDNIDGVCSFDNSSLDSHQKERQALLKMKLNTIMEKLVATDTETFNYYLDRLNEFDLLVSKHSKFALKEVINGMEFPVRLAAPTTGETSSSCNATNKVVVNVIPTKTKNTDREFIVRGITGNLSDDYLEGRIIGQIINGQFISQVIDSDALSHIKKEILGDDVENEAMEGVQCVTAEDSADFGGAGNGRFIIRVALGEKEDEEMECDKS